MSPPTVSQTRFLVDSCPPTATILAVRPLNRSKLAGHVSLSQLAHQALRICPESVCKTTGLGIDVIAETLLSRPPYSASSASTLPTGPPSGESGASSQVKL